MTTTLCQPEQAVAKPVSPESIRDRIAQINASWSPQERMLRAIEGQIRREELLEAIGFYDQKACA